jgi:hypothetical protein
MKKVLLVCSLLLAGVFTVLQAQPYYLRGAAAPCGWSGNFTPQCQLTDPDGDGLFTLPVNLGAAPIGIQAFKIYNQANDTWFPGNNAWYNHQGGTVTFNFRPATSIVGVSDGTNTICAPGDWVVPNWTNTTPMTRVGTSNTYCITVANPGSYNWKPTSCGTWNSYDLQTGVREQDDPGNWGFTTTTPNQQICVEYDPATGRVISTIPPPTGYFLRGSAGACSWFGNFVPGCKLTDPDGNGCYDLTVNLGTTPLGLQEFKIYRAETDTWYPNGSNVWYLHRGGPVTFRICEASNEVYVFDDFTGNVCAPGDFNGWNNASAMKKYDKGTYCMNIPTPGTYEWKPTYCGTWNSWEANGGVRSTGPANWSITTTVPDQQVCVTYDFATGRLRAGSFYVPTMTQWGLFLFGLFVMVFGLVTVRQHKLAMAGTQNSNFSLRNLPFNSASFVRTMGVCLALAIFVFSAAVMFFGYEMTSADVPGTLLSLPLIAYLVQLVRNEK